MQNEAKNQAPCFRQSSSNNSCAANAKLRLRLQTWRFADRAVRQEQLIALRNARLERRGLSIRFLGLGAGCSASKRENRMK